MSRDQYWKEMVEKFQATTLSQAAFCVEQDIKCHNFRYWLAKYTPSVQTASFVKLASSPLANTSLVIEYPNGVKIHSSQTASLTALRSLINLL
jgi:hypothetical protein